MKKRPRIVYFERGVITTPVTPIASRETVGYGRAGTPINAPMLTKDEARADARRSGAVAEFRRIS